MFRIMIHTVLFCLCLLVADGVFGVDSDVMKSVSVMEGDSVTLNTDVTDIQRDDHILWMFKLNSSYIRIAEIYNQIIKILDERFRDRLQLDNQTGSLIITNTRETHTGLYKAQIMIKHEEVSYRNFNVTVYAPLSIPDIIRNSSQCSSSSERSSSSKCVLLCSVNVTQVTLSWYKGNSLLSSISVSDLNTLSLPLEVEYQDNNTYSCVVNNPITNQTKHLYITDLCLSCSELDQRSYFLTLITVSVVLLIMALAVSVKCCYSRNRKQAKQVVQTDEEEVHYADALLYMRNGQHAEAAREDQTVYSQITMK